VQSRGGKWWKAEGGSGGRLRDFPVQANRQSLRKPSILLKALSLQLWLCEALLSILAHIPYSVLLANWITWDVDSNLNKGTMGPKVSSEKILLSTTWVLKGYYILVCLCTSSPLDVISHTKPLLYWSPPEHNMNIKRILYTCMSLHVSAPRCYFYTKPLLSPPSREMQPHACHRACEQTQVAWTSQILNMKRSILMP